jgi:hypothetical protein
MSGPDQDDQAKGFLARWSQRKQEAKQPEHDAPVAEAKLPTEQIGASEPEPEFDLSSLPKLEDITSSTDITAFLRDGVPEHLRNAALRKSWALDPSIRNYVSPALEYAYDWNTPGGVPGSSEIGAGVDVARLVSQIMGEPESESANLAPSPKHVAAQETVPGLPAEVRGEDAASAAQKPGIETASMAEKSDAGSAALQQPMRRHGSAKPLD